MQLQFSALRQLFSLCSCTCPMCHATAVPDFSHISSEAWKSYEMPLLQQSGVLEASRREGVWDWVHLSALYRAIGNAIASIAIAFAAGLSRNRFFHLRPPSKGDNSAISRPETLRLRSSCDRIEKSDWFCKNSRDCRFAIENAIIIASD